MQRFTLKKGMPGNKRTAASGRAPKTPTRPTRPANGQTYPGEPTREQFPYWSAQQLNDAMENGSTITVSRFCNLQTANPNNQKDGSNKGLLRISVAVSFWMRLSAALAVKSGVELLFSLRLCPGINIHSVIAFSQRFLVFRLL